MLHRVSAKVVYVGVHVSFPRDVTTFNFLPASEVHTVVCMGDKPMPESLMTY